MFVVNFVYNCMFPCLNNTLLFVLLLKESHNMCLYLLNKVIKGHTYVLSAKVWWDWQKKSKKQEQLTLIAPVICKHYCTVTKTIYYFLLHAYHLETNYEWRFLLKKQKMHSKVTDQHSNWSIWWFIYQANFIFFC